ncbi:unnamed protein product, partial [Meganyctiphanes norvegica]
RYEDLRLSFDWNSLGTGSTPMELCVTDLASLHNSNAATGGDTPPSLTPPCRPKRSYAKQSSHSPPCRPKIVVYDAFPPWRRSFKSDKPCGKESKSVCDATIGCEEKVQFCDSACALPLESKPETELLAKYEGKGIHCTEILNPQDEILAKTSPSKGGTKKKISNRENIDNVDLHGRICEIKKNYEQGNTEEISSQIKSASHTALHCPIMTEILVNAATQWPAYYSDSLDLKEQQISNTQKVLLTSSAQVHRSQECLTDAEDILEEQLDDLVEEPISVPIDTLSNKENQTQSEIANQESVPFSSRETSLSETYGEHNHSISPSILPPSIHVPTCSSDLQYHSTLTSPSSLPPSVLVSTCSSDIKYQNDLTSSSSLPPSIHVPTCLSVLKHHNYLTSSYSLPPSIHVPTCSSALQSHSALTSSSSLPSTMHVPTCSSPFQYHNAMKSMPDSTSFSPASQFDNASLSQNSGKDNFSSNLDIKSSQASSEYNKNISNINTASSDCKHFTSEPNVHIQDGFVSWAGHEHSSALSSLKNYTSLNYSYNFIQDTNALVGLESETGSQKSLILDKEFSNLQLNHPDDIDSDKYLDEIDNDKYLDVPPKSLPIQSCIVSSLSLQNFPHSLPTEQTIPQDTIDIEHISLSFTESETPKKEVNNLEIANSTHSSLDCSSNSSNSKNASKYISK